MDKDEVSWIGVDVSKHNGSINWGKASNSIHFAIIRAGFGANNIDPKLNDNVNGCMDNAIPYGFYWFSYAYTVEMAKREAQYFIAAVKAYKPEYPLYFDFEGASVEYAKKAGVKIDKQLASAMAIAFCTEVEKAGYYAGVYADPDTAKKYYTPEVFSRFTWWQAHWATSPTVDVPMWQFSSTGKVNGFSGRVDMNMCYKDYPYIIKSLGLNGWAKDSAKQSKLVEAHYMYKRIVRGCSHGSGCSSVTTVLAHKKINCAGWVNILATHAGLKRSPAVVNHSKAGIPYNPANIKSVVCNSNALSFGKWYPFNKPYSKLPDEWKTGCIYVYDSNIAVGVKPGLISSCNEAAAQMTTGKKKYITPEQTSGYCFTHNIYWVFVPEET